jgi:hypothetical protein
VVGTLTASAHGVEQLARIKATETIKKRIGISLAPFLRHSGVKKYGGFGPALAGLAFLDLNFASRGWA